MKIIAIFILLLMLTPILSADETFKTFQLSQIVLDYIDVSISLYGIEKGYSEINPIGRLYIKSPQLTLAIHTALNIGTIMVTNFIYKKNKKLGWFVIISLNLIKAYVVYRNIKILTMR